MVEIRTNCKVCGGDLPNSRFRTFCSKQCRQRFYNQKNKERMTDWQRKRRDKEAMISNPNKRPCLICGKWYVQVCSHIYQVHGLTAREYREKYGLDVKKGLIPKWYKEKKGNIAIKNGTANNILEAGKKFRFKKGDKRAGRYKRSKQTLERLRTQHKKLSTSDSCTDIDSGV